MKKTKDMYELTHLQISLKLRNSRCRLGKLSTSSCKRNPNMSPNIYVKHEKQSEKNV